MLIFVSQSTYFFLYNSDLFTKEETKWQLKASRRNRFYGRIDRFIYANIIYANLRFDFCNKNIRLSTFFFFNEDMFEIKINKRMNFVPILAYQNDKQSPYKFICRIY